jgi:hypothetical protein
MRRHVDKLSEKKTQVVGVRPKDPTRATPPEEANIKDRVSLTHLKEASMLLEDSPEWNNQQPEDETDSEYANLHQTWQGSFKKPQEGSTLHRQQH